MSDPIFRSIQSNTSHISRIYFRFLLWTSKLINLRYLSEKKTLVYFQVNSINMPIFAYSVLELGKKRFSVKKWIVAQCQGIRKISACVVVVIVHMFTYGFPFLNLIQKAPLHMRLFLLLFTAVLSPRSLY